MKISSYLNHDFSIKTFGNSMHPLLLNGDTILINKVPFNKIEIDDLITFKYKKYFITHRVIFKTKSYLIAKGDNNLYPDKKVFKKNILGKVVGLKRSNKIINPEYIYLFQSTFYYQEIIKFKKLLEKEKLDFIFLKGLPLHLYLEKQLPKRVYVDCDVLINPKDFSEIKKIFKKMGYKPLENPLSLLHKKLKDKISEISFYKIINNLKIIFDIHLEAVFLMTQLGHLQPLYPQELLNDLSKELLIQKKEIKINNEIFPILSFENLILYLALHIFHHNFKGYNRYYLLDKVIKSKRINFIKLSAKITKYKLENFVYPVFLLLEKYYSSPLPKKFMISIKPKQRIINYVQKNIIKEDIFSEEKKVTSGIKRFKFIFTLSPYSLFRKVLIFLNLQIIYSLIWVLKRKTGFLIFRNYFFQK